MIAQSATPKPVIFLHIPKTAGTTLGQIMLRNYQPDSIFSIYQGDHVRLIKNLEESHKKKLQLIRGHVSYGLHRYLPHSATYITLLRDPIERIISHYYYILKTPKHYLYSTLVGQKMSLEAYLKSQLTLELDNGQTRILAGSGELFPADVEFGQCTEELLTIAKNHLNQSSFLFGLAEEFNSSLLLFQEVLGWNRIVYTNHNVNGQRPQKQDLSQAVLRLIEKQNELDIELYHYARSKFKSLIREKGLLFQLKTQLFESVNAVYQNVYLPLRMPSAR